jgi:hypothetical protein
VYFKELKEGITGKEALEATPAQVWRIVAWRMPSALVKFDMVTLHSVSLEPSLSWTETWNSLLFILCQ